MNTLLNFFTILVLAFAAQVIHAQNKEVIAKGVIAIENCTAYRERENGKYIDKKRPIEVKAGDIFAFGPYYQFQIERTRIQSDDFSKPVTREKFLRVNYLPKLTYGAPDTIWIPEKSVKIFEYKLNQENPLPYRPYSGIGRIPFGGWSNGILQAALEAAPENLKEPITQLTQTINENDLKLKPLTQTINKNDLKLKPQPRENIVASNQTTQTPQDVIGSTGTYWLGSLQTSFNISKRNIWVNNKVYNYESALEGANSIYATDNTIYVTGKNNNKAVIWKNGEIEYLENEVNSEATGILIKDSIEYIVGTRGEGNGLRAVLWINRKVHTLDETRGEESWIPRGIIINSTNNEIIIIGYDNNYIKHAMGTITPILWKGTLSNTTNTINMTEKTNIGTPTFEERYRIFVINNAIYVTKFFNSLGAHHIEFRKLEDKVFKKITYPNDVYPNGFWIFNDNLYAATKEGLKPDKLWRNNIELKLETIEDSKTLATVNTDINYIYEFNNDIYVIGRRNSYYNGNEQLPAAYILWKNGKIETNEKQLSSGTVNTQHLTDHFTVYTLSGNSYIVQPLLHTLARESLMR